MITQTEETRVIAAFGSSPDETSPHQVMPAIWLASRGYRVTCIAPGPGRSGERRTPLGHLDVDYLGCALSAVGHARLALRLWKYRRECGPRAVFYVHGSVVCPAAWVALLGIRARRVIYHTQDFLEPGRHPHWEFFEKRMARRAGQVLCNEPNRARFMASYYRLPRVPNAVRTALPSAWPIPARDPAVRGRMIEALGLQRTADPAVIFHAGPISDVRCSLAVLDALSLLPERFGLVFTGTRPGSPRHEGGIHAVRAAGIERRVAFLPHLSFESLLEHMAASDVGLLLYPNDGVGNYFQAPGRLSEYLSTGLPIVTSAFPGLENLVLRYRLGAPCDPTSPAGIAEAILTASQGLHDDPGTRERLRALAKDELCFERGASLLEDAVRRAFEGLPLD